MTSKSTKEKNIDILIGIGAFVLSICTGLFIGVAVLCTGTAWLCIRKANVAKYTILVLLGNIVVGLITFCALVNSSGFGMGDVTGFATILDVFLVGPVLIVVAIFVIAVVVIRFALQWLTIAVFSKKEKT